MDPAATRTSDLPIPMNQTAIHNNERIPTDLEGSTVGVDRKTKKRIQNRVAQRTYRTRIKQRLHDLQQQVHQLQQKEGDQQHDTQLREVEADDSGNEGVAFYTPFPRAPIITPVHGHSGDPFNLEVTSQDISGVKSTDSSPWAGIPGQPNMWNSPLGGTNFAYNPPAMRTRPPLDLAAGTTMPTLSPTRLPLDLSRSVLCSPTCHGEPPRDTLAFSRVNEDNSQRQPHSRADKIYDEDGQICHSHGFNSPHLSPWGHKLELKTSTDDSIATEHMASASQPSFYQDKSSTTSMATTPSQWPGNWMQSQQATVEQQFEYVLGCAQRAGFDSFDTMALYYYTRNFHPTSALALEQRLSRNRRLPELLAELRKQSATWSALQRRGYQDETLKAAEEICTMEYSEFQRAEASGSENESVNEAALGDMLPNLWALLTGLVSSNAQLSQRQVSEMVFMSMRILCGLEVPQNQPGGTSTSRQSPR
ncbi:hypothetical protein F5Y12DRAFT_750054 [Xylaria sp. FL1777]|nr:hypothetical protein F5Y12DRAFT_750054 [Xylaria sp. FL1777]